MTVTLVSGRREQCVAAAWPLAEDWRKLHAGTALHGADGALLAAAQVWIVPRGASAATLGA